MSEALEEQPWNINDVVDSLLTRVKAIEARLKDDEEINLLMITQKTGEMAARLAYDKVWVKLAARFTPEEVSRAIGELSTKAELAEGGPGER